MSSQAVRELGSGDWHTVVLAGTSDEESKIYTWGKNNYGQLGGTTSEMEQNKPLNIASLEGIVFNQISCGGYHTAVRRL
jgi:alpha-tubulin suppressor-like RCC1 family protein